MQGAGKRSERMDGIPGFPEGDPDELSLDHAFGHHAIEYWVWSGTRLVPASPEQVAILREYEAMTGLAYRQHSGTRASSRAGRGWPAYPSWRWLVRVLAASGAAFTARRPRALTSAHRADHRT